MPPLRLSRREKNLVIMTLGFVIFYVFYQFLLLPQWEEIGKIKAQVQKGRLELEVAEGKMAVLEAIEKRMGTLPGEVVSPGSAKVFDPKTTEEKALEVLRALAWATSKSKLNLILIKPMIGQEAGYKFELTCSGSYSQLYDFLKILSELKILMVVDSMHVTGGGVRRPVLNIKMLLTAYH